MRPIPTDGLSGKRAVRRLGEVIVKVLKEAFEQISVDEGLQSIPFISNNFHSLFNLTQGDPTLVLINNVTLEENLAFSDDFYIVSCMTNLVI